MVPLLKTQNVQRKVAGLATLLLCWSERKRPSDKDSRRSLQHATPWVWDFGQERFATEYTSFARRYFSWLALSHQLPFRRLRNTNLTSLKSGAEKRSTSIYDLPSEVFLISKLADSFWYTISLRTLFDCGFLRCYLFCKDNTSQDRFRSVKLYKEFAYRSEIE